MRRNEAVFSRLQTCATRGMLPHALILSGTGERMEAARYAAAALECTADGTRPCLVCPACKKVMDGIHPDVRVLHDFEHKTMSVDMVRAARSDAYVIPNEGRRKVYIFDDCSQLDHRGQDILLKVVEEGPPYAAFLFLAEDSATLLPTLRSRCMELSVRPEEEREVRIGDGAEQFCRLLKRGNGRDAAEFLLRLSTAKPKREELLTFLRQSRTLLARSLLLRCGGAESAEETVRACAGLPQSTLMRLIELLGQCENDCDFNAGAGLLLGALAAELEVLL